MQAKMKNKICRILHYHSSPKELYYEKDNKMVLSFDCILESSSLNQTKCSEPARQLNNISSSKCCEII